MNILEKMYNMYEEDIQQYKEHKLTAEEIKELTEIVYNESCSVFPMNCFFNDVRDTKKWNERYDTNLAFKDFCLMMWHIIKWQKSEEVLEIIKKKKVNLQTFDIIIKQDWSFEDYENEENDRNTGGQQFSNERLTKKEFYLLKEKLQNDI